MVLSRGATWKYTYLAPNGMEFPPVPINAVQQIEVDATAGSFVLKFNGSAYTSPIDYDANAEDIQDALRSLTTISGFNVTVTGDGPFTVTFVDDLAGQDVPEIEADTTLLTGTVTISTVTHGVEGTTSQVVVTDRAGGLLATFDGEVLTDRVNYKIAHDDLDAIPAGANFEMFVTIPDDGIYKVRYGRVVRSEASFPLSPVSTDTFTPAMYEDDMQHSIPGPYWIQRFGAVGMFPHTPTPPYYTMGVRNGFYFTLLGIINISLPAYAQACVLWYAPMRSDSVKINFSLIPAGPGLTTVFMCASYSVKNWLGIVFDGDAHTVQFHTGLGPVGSAAVGTPVTHNIPSGGQNYTVSYNNATRTASLYVGDNLEPIISWTDTNYLLTTGMGYRYIGQSWRADLTTSGPRLYYWKAEDTV